MIYVTGDTHGLKDFHKLKVFAETHPKLKINDYVIIAGDFGAVWNSETIAENLRPYSELPFTVLFVDGNHENFELINSYPVKIWNGGKTHRIKPNIIHLMRGQVFEIEGKTFFTFGGATSIDKDYRTEGINWWRRELPTYEEIAEGVANLKQCNNKVDYIITHSCCQRALTYPELKVAAGIKKLCRETYMLSDFDNMIDFKHWYFGHFHIDVTLGDKYTALYNNVITIEEK